MIYDTEFQNLYFMDDEDTPAAPLEDDEDDNDEIDTAWEPGEDDRDE